MGFETHNLSSEWSTEAHANWVAVNCQPNFRQVIFAAYIDLSNKHVRTVSIIILTYTLLVTLCLIN